MATNPVGLEWLQEKQQQQQEHTLARPSGLLYKPLRQGQGTHHPAFDTYCQVDMEISRIVVSGDGDTSTKFATQVVETTTTEGEPPLVRPQDTLPAIEEALQRMVEGDWWELYVPSHLGYGSGKSGLGDKDIHSNYKDDALLISLELVAVSAGDKIPRGEEHLCKIQRVQEDSTDDQMMTDFDFSSSIVPSKECNERDTNYIHKVLSWENRSPKVEDEIIRLRSVLKKGDHSMKQSLAEWARRRIHILKQFLHETMRICTIKTATLEQQGMVQVSKDCNAQEQEYVHKVIREGWDTTKLQEEITRLAHMDQESMDAALASWMRRRIRILKQLHHNQRKIMAHSTATTTTTTSTGSSEARQEGATPQIESEPQQDATPSQQEMPATTTTATTDNNNGREEVPPPPTTPEIPNASDHQGQEVMQTLPEMQNTEGGHEEL